MSSGSYPNSGRARALAFALALAALPAASLERIEKTLDPEPDRAAISAQSRQVLESLYEEWGTALVRSGYRVTVRFSDFRTLLPGEYASTRLADVVTLRPGRRLQVTPSVRSDQHGQSFGVTYTPEWLEAERNPAEVADLAADPTLAGALAAAEAGGFAESLNLAAVTTFRVQIRAFGKGLSYRAALSWRELPAGDDPGSWILQDLVAASVVEASRETRRIAPEDVLERELSEHMNAEARHLLAGREKAGESKD